jgi:hypothetical protein
MSDPRYITRNYLKESLPGSLSGIKSFLRNNNFKDVKTVRKTIQGIRTYSIFKKTKISGARRIVVPVYNGDLLSCDLAQCTQLKPLKNKGIRYLLIIYELLTKFI